ncbi:CLUMA_CG008756, isoform A [Clunio marinus]|uniref:CLUMA_CG008756, isoform A n=1 Tax=Clunio marinus TaxID=568069 RepID=A0A1J1I728_9DIPT|nr:CLUMA_CG008756, isoform A [Clunio marinus]
MENLRKHDLNVKVVLEDIFSDFKNIHQKCRLCFKEVYHQEPKIYLTNDMINKIHAVFQVNMSIDGKGSEFVCSRCESNSNNCFERFRSMKNDNNDEELASIHENSIKIEIEEATCEVEDGNQILKSRDIIQRGQQFFPCDVCGKQFKNVIGVQRHCRRVHSNSRNGVAKDLNKQREHKSKDFQCQICKSSYVLKSSLQRHIMKIHEDKKFSCTSCKQVYKSEKGLKAHIISIRRPIDITEKTI